jgi:putative membrane protein
MTNVRSIALLGAAALAASSFSAPALAGGASVKADQSHAAAQQPLTSQNFVMYAGNADYFEIEASKIAMQKAQSAEVKLYAEQMVKTHTLSTNKIAAAARQAGVTPTPPVLTTGMQQKLAELQTASANSFDERYINLQLEAHERALRLHRSYAISGDQPTLRAVSSDTARTVEHHLAEARRISTTIVADRPGNS